MSESLQTIRDFVRFAVSQFRGANLAFGHGIASAYEDAFYLVFDSLNLPMDEDPAPYMDARLTAHERALLSARIKMRVDTRKPTAYITGRAYLQGLAFTVDERVLIPRSFIAEILGTYDHPILPADRDTIERVADICTGSGCLAILAAYLFPNAAVDAVDISADALAIATKNVAGHDMTDRVRLHQGDVFAPLGGNKYDLIITNPPYVDAVSMAKLPDEYRHEPSLALAAGADGMDIVKRILADAKAHLTKNGVLICEIGNGRAVFEELYPNLPVTWLDTTHSEGEVFAITAAGLKRLN